MRTLDSSILTAQAQPVVTPRHAARIEPAVLRLLSNNYTLAPGVRTDIPQTYLKVGTAFIAAYRDTAGSGRVRYSVGPLDTSATQLETGGTPGAMRYGIDSSQRVYYASDGTGSWQLRRTSAITSTTNPVTFTTSTWGPTFGSGPASTASLVRRIEAIAWLQNGQVLVAEGEHRFDTGYSHVRFYLIASDGNSYVTLRNAITMPFNDSYGTTWYDIAPHAVFMSAVSASTASTAQVMIVANSSDAGRPLVWTIRQGVESEPQPVVPLDPAGSSVGVWPCTLVLLNNTYPHLTVRVTRSQVDDASAEQFEYDGVLVARSFGLPFSFGARVHWLCNEKRLGTPFIWQQTGDIDPFAPKTLCYIGNGSFSLYELTKDYWTNASSENIDARVVSWQLQQAADGADTLVLDLDNADGALTDDTDVVPGSRVYLRSGYVARAYDVNYRDQVGVYLIDAIEHTVTAGTRTMRITARDSARKTLLDWRAPFTGQFQARDKIITALDSWHGLSRLTPEDSGYTMGADGLVCDEYNTPTVALAEVEDAHRGLLMKARVKFTVDDAYHLGLFGFAFGVDDTGTGNVMFVPKANSWTGHTMPKPRLRAWNLTPVDLNDPGAPYTMWDFEPNATALVEANSPADVRTAAVTATYTTDSTYSVAVGTTTDLAFRVAGRFGYLYSKTSDYDPDTCASNATWTLQTVVTLDAQAPSHRGLYTRAGFVVGQDSWFSRDAFDQAEYGDIERGLTDAGETYAFASAVSTGDVEGVMGGGVSTRVFVPDASAFEIGEWLRFRVNRDGLGNYEDWYRVVRTKYTTAPDYIDVWDGAQTTNGINVTDEFNDACTIYRQADGAEWGYAYSGSNEDRVYIDDPDIVGDQDLIVTRVWDTGATLKAREVGGRAAFISNDNTAIQMRYVASDGVRHSLRSGNTGLNLAWDDTNPVPLKDTMDNYAVDPGQEPEFNAGSSEPHQWRMVMHHGRLLGTTAASYGLPSTGYMKIDDEIVRYEDVTFARRGESTNAGWCVIPTYYTPLAAASAGSVTFTQWSTGAAFPGDNPGDIASPAGLMVEFTNRNTSDESTSKQYYLVSTTTNAFTIDEAYPHSSRALETVAVISGRGQFGTQKIKHDADAPVTYYPCTTAGVPATVVVSRFGAWAGRFVDTQTAIQRIVGMAGGLSAGSVFRTMSGAGAESEVLTGATSQSMTLEPVVDLADFHLQLTAHVPTSDTLHVTFRDFYKLTFQTPTTGQLLLRLETTKDENNGGVVASGRYRTLEQVTLDMSPSSLAVSSVATQLIDLIAQGGEIIVEINNQPAWTFDLAGMTDGTNSYDVRTTGDIIIGYTGSGMPSHTVIARLVELSTEVGRVVMATDQTAMELIEQVRGNQSFTHVPSVTGQTSQTPLTFSAWWTRDDGGTMSANLFRDSWRHDDALIVGHVQVVGDGVSGEASSADVLAAYGYSFDQVTAEWVTTLQQAQHEARLALARNRQAASVRGVEGRGLLHLQPEDEVTLSYGDTEVECIITDIALDADRAAVSGSYTLRAKVDP